MRACVLGCGPAGLIAAHTLTELGHEVTIYSRKQQSFISGAQFLHEPVFSGIHDYAIHVKRIGTREGYAQKVYGNPEVPVSWDSYDMPLVKGWDMRRTYDKLWDMYEASIVEIDLRPADAQNAANLHEATFSTVPLKLLCVNGHEFKSQDVYITTGEQAGPNMMIYNGESAPWYRWSRIGGHMAWEYPHEVPEAVRVTKPLSTDCDCHPGIHRIGRYGTWQKGALVHQVPEEVRNALQ